MRRVSIIGSLLKKIYRMYNSSLLDSLEKKGFTDLRPSFLEVLLFVCENEGASIKAIGSAVGLKKQTMTSHLNELERRGYITRQSNQDDRREQRITLTEYGEKFKLKLSESIRELEEIYVELVGDVELERMELQLGNFYEKLKLKSKQKNEPLFENA